MKSKTVKWALIALFAAYQAASFIEVRSGGSGIFRKTLGDWFWPAQWKMFTGASPRQSAVDFEGYRDGAWAVLPMEQWYPFKWESGYRWERNPVYQRKSRNLQFLKAACAKSGAEKTRMVRYRWPKKLGTMDQSRPADAERKVVRTLRCDEEIKGPEGRVI